MTGDCDKKHHNDISVKDIIGKTLREGKFDPKDPFAITKKYWSPTEGKYRELRVVLSKDSPGSITTAYPD